jgi:hypothetical protein
VTCTCTCSRHNPFVLLDGGAVNNQRMHRADQTPWLTLRFTTPGRLDPCNGPHVPIGEAPVIQTCRTPSSSREVRRLIYCCRPAFPLPSPHFVGAARS